MATSDYFVASSFELEPIAAHRGVPPTLRKVEAPGFDAVALQRLAKMLATGDEGTEPGEARHHGDSGEWFILDVTLAMTERLANLTDTEIADNGAAIAAIPELAWPAEEGRRVLRELRELSKIAVETQKTLHVFVST